MALRLYTEGHFSLLHLSSAQERAPSSKKDPIELSRQEFKHNVRVEKCIRLWKGRAE